MGLGGVGQWLYIDVIAVLVLFMFPSSCIHVFSSYFPPDLHKRLENVSVNIEDKCRYPSTHSSLGEPLGTRDFCVWATEFTGVLVKLGAKLHR